MSALATIYIKAETLKTLLDTVTKKGDKGVELTISINDDVNQFGQNVSAFVSQSKEAREAKKPKFYTGNGKVIWTDGKINKPEQQASNTTVQAEDDLPF